MHYFAGQPNGYFRAINSNGDVEFFGYFSHGNLVGNCWKSLIGGSFLVSDRCDFSGKNTVYFYPDCRTAILGNFGSNGILESGTVTEIVTVELDAAQNPKPIFCQLQVRNKFKNYEIEAEVRFRMPKKL